MLTISCPICNIYIAITMLFAIRKLKKIFLKLRLVSDLPHRKSNFQFIWWFRVVSDLSPTLGKIGHQWFFKKKWYPWWQNQWFRLCNQWSHNSYKHFWQKNPKKILLSIFNIDLNVNKCPILPLFTVPYMWFANVLLLPVASVGEGAGGGRKERKSQVKRQWQRGQCIFFSVVFIPSPISHHGSVWVLHAISLLLTTVTLLRGCGFA